MVKKPFAGLALVVLSTVAAAQRPAPPLGPHPQANLPTLTLPSYQLSHPPEVVRAVYKYAAEHPEVLRYMPCYCGCDMEGHRNNDDCFVKARAKNGDVTQWEEHGMVCAMCLSVAQRAMTMASGGASLPDIRADIERRYGHITESRTPTPNPPGKTPK